MSTRRYLNRAKSGALALPAKLRRRPTARGAPISTPARGRVVHRRRARHGQAWFEELVASLSDRGWFTCAGFLRPALADALAAEARALWARGAFRPAGIGRERDWHVEPDVRGDWLHWLDPSAPTPPQREFLARMEELRTCLNRELCLTLHELELQYAAYPPGTSYRRHIDQFRHVQARLVTVILYLNRGWSPRHGGTLRLYPDPEATEPAADVVPLHNAFVCFRSDRIPHEVLVPSRHRFSLGGWFRVRPEIPLGTALR